MNKTKTKFVSGILVGVLVGVISTLIATSLINIFNITESNIVNIDNVPQAPWIEITDYKGGLKIHLIEKYNFKNYGLKSGFIDKIEVRPLGLDMTPLVDLIFIDKKPLHWREEREIKCEYLINIDKIQYREIIQELRNISKTNTEFRTFIYDNNGKNIYTGSIRIYFGNKSFNDANNS